MSRDVASLFALSLLWLTVSSLTVAPLVAQHEPTPADVMQGERLFLANCAACHGPEGDAVFGVDLAHGEFRHASTDADLIRIIKSGIAGTDMPPSNFTDEQAGIIVGYLRSLASTSIAAVPGDADRGKAVFEGKGTCLTCHRVHTKGSKVGPDLTDIGQFRRADELERSLVDPGAEIQPQNRSFRVVTRDGATVIGRLLNHDSYTVQMIDSQEKLRSFLNASLRESGFVEQSSMPSYRGKLTPDELTDVIKYLVTLRPSKGKP
jgi:putative heme-binding domain-containing protein